MNPVIAPGDRVRVEKTKKGYTMGYEKATVLNWTTSGNVRIKLDDKLLVKVVPAARVKKIADGPNANMNSN